jgi:hypothetical protein
MMKPGEPEQDADKPVSKLDRLRKRKGFVGNVEDIIGMDWSKEWCTTRSKRNGAGIRSTV